MSYFAVAATRTDDQWSATEVDLDAVEDVEDAADVLRDAAPEALVSVLFVEAADEYLTILRLDAGDDLRAFCSDAEYADESRLGEALVADLDSETVEETDDDSGVVSELEAEPVGEADLLSDLGIPAPVLLSLCAKDGMLPADVTSEIAGTLGCLDAVEELRDV